MDIKDILMISLSVPATLWAIYESYNVLGYVHDLKFKTPECFQSNPNRIALFVGTQVILALIMGPIQAAARSFFDIVVSPSKFVIGSQNRKIKVEILGERTYRLILYITWSAIGLWILNRSDFSHKYLFGSESDPQYFKNYPCYTLPSYTEEFYIVKFAYHFFESLNAVILHRKRFDFTENLLHHIVTIVMVGYSYATNIFPIGIPIMLVMDLSDVFVSIFKLTVDVSDRIQAPAFFTMIFTWAYLRMWFFPVYLMKEIWVQSIATGHPV